MGLKTFFGATIFLILGSWVFISAAAAQSGGALLQSKKEAEAKGYIFAASRDEIVARAKKEGKLVVLSSQDAAAIDATAKAFRKKYPFIDVKASEISGTDTYIRMIGELKIGKTTDWDVNYVAFDYYDDYLPHQKKFDMLGMARHGVLKIPVEMIDPVNRHIVVLQSNMQALAYNKKMISKEKGPETFDDLLKPEFKGKKFATDIRPRAVAALVPAWGLEKVLAYAKNLAAQQPIWTRGDARSLPYMTGGEIPMTLGLNYKSYLRFKKKDVLDVLDARVIEPVPVRLTEAEGVSATGRNPYAPLLWLEFQTSPEGQAILDETDLAASHLTRGTFHEKATRGKQLSVVDWKHYMQMENYQNEVVKAFGFPRADK
ncbi:MAG: extracellular solute-binding protein [Deltaproteobacteria bacterium]|nr:extracellular solute-binding protein [Deltaproteobacteria bacterium]